VTINFILNGEDMVINTSPEVRLIDLLREIYGLTGAKAGCRAGVCGVCSVLFKGFSDSGRKDYGDVVKACLIPAFRLKDAEIITIEGFSQTDEYRDIVEGFAEAKVENCGFCAAAKILAAEALLVKKPQPLPEDVFLAFQGIRCRCTEPESLVKGVLAAAEKRQWRLYGRNA
jgi:carbon-monoxide dehydrogenase small subunit